MLRRLSDTGGTISFREIKLDRKIPKDLQAICMKALHRSRGHRYSNATSFLEDLQRYRHGKSPSTGIPDGKGSPDGIENVSSEQGFMHFLPTRK